MALNFIVNDQEIKDISTVIISLRNILFDYRQLISKEIGFIAQSLSEKHSTFQGELFRTRAMLTKVLGANPETGEINPDSPIYLATDNQLITLLSGVLMLNNVEWTQGLNSTFDSFKEMYNTLEFKDYLKPITDNITYIQELSNNIDLFLMSNRSFDNVDSSLSALGKEIQQLKVFYPDLNMTGYSIDSTKTSMHSEDIKKISLDNTLIITDVPSRIGCVHYQRMKKIFINRNNFAKDMFEGYNTKLIINSLNEIKLF